MKKTLILFIIFFFFSSCSVYLDNPHENEIRSESLDFTYLNHYNEFVYKSKINGKADGQIFYTTHFSVRLPKKIKNWRILGNDFFFEFDGKEIIHIYSGYVNEGTAGDWIARETNNEEVDKKLHYYWDERKYSEESLNVNQSNRISKVYSDGRISILLYNIKRDNFENYLALIKNFKYLN